MYKWGMASPASCSAASSLAQRGCGAGLRGVALRARGYEKGRV